MTIKLTAIYAITEKHPDYKEEYNGRIFEYSDTYRFNEDIYGNDYESMLHYAINDLVLVISGGYQFKEDYFIGAYISEDNSNTLVWNCNV